MSEHPALEREGACIGSQAAAAAADAPASRASFQELLALLSAKFESLTAENEALRTDNTKLLAKGTSRDQEVASPSGSRPYPEANERSAQGNRASRCAGEPSEENPSAGQSEADLEHAPQMDVLRQSYQSDRSTPSHAEEKPQLLPEVLSVWKASSAKLHSRFSSSVVASLHNLPSIGGASGCYDSLLADATILGRLGSRVVLSPESKKRLVWDTLSMLFLIFDIMHTPLMAFYDPNSAFETAMSGATTVFWTFDIGVSFLRGYYSRVALEMRIEQIAKRYLKCEFFPDLIICSADWTLLIANTASSSAVNFSRFSKLMRIARIARILRLLRVVKVKAFIEMLDANSVSISARTLVHVGKNLILIIVVNHFIACAWYAVGGLGTPSWRDVLDHESRSILYCYATSLHWSVTQFTPASMEIQPTRTSERVFAICVIFTGLVMFSTFVSSITSSMTALRIERQERYNQKEFLRRYIIENQISRDLASRVSAFLSKYHFGTQRRTCRSKVALVKALPLNLRLMLDWEVYQPALIRVPFFRQCSEFCSPALLQICHRAVDEVSMGACEEMFHCGQSASAMHITISGSMHYYFGFDEHDPEVIQGRDNTNIGESALWLTWVYQGRVFSLTPCDFLSIDPTELAQALVHHPTVLLACKEHARLYYFSMQEALSEREAVWRNRSISSSSLISTPGSQFSFPRKLWSDLYSIDRRAALEMARSSFNTSVACEPSTSRTSMSSRGTSKQTARADVEGASVSV